MEAILHTMLLTGEGEENNKGQDNNAQDVWRVTVVRIKMNNN